MSKAIKEKEKKKSKGGPKRRSYLKQIAAQRGATHGEYMKYGDVAPSDVHEGIATYGQNSYLDSPTTNLTSYSVAVKRGHGKDYYIFDNKLYHITHPGGATYEAVKI